MPVKPVTTVSVRCLTLLLLFIALVTLNGCALLGGAPTKRGELLEQRIHQSMNARVNGDWGTVYDCFCADYRTKVPRDSFLSRPRLSFNSYRLDSLEISDNGQSADVKVWASVTTKGFTFPEAPQKQHWLFEQGNWCQQVKTDGLQGSLP